MKRRLIELSAFLFVLGYVGLLVVSSGLIPVKASPGHWPITRAFLSFAMRRSVETHAMGTRVPDLNDASLVLRGAGHYDLGCQPCHGAPGERSSPITDELTPHPPYLPEVVPYWEPAELFQIVKHGVKMTGMPAWPARERDDEVWAIVAFLVRLPAMDPGEYRRLAHGEGGAVGAITAPCVQCHGRHGLGRGVGAFPRLAGQSPAYLAAALEAYANGDRHSGIMGPVAAALDEETIRSLARHYGAAAASVPGAGDSGGSVVMRGERIAREGIPARKVPACVQCHGPGSGDRNPFYPSLDGQYAEYLALQLRLFREERRGGSAYVEIMREAVHALEEEEAQAVAAWYASLPWGTAEGSAPPRR